MTTKTMRSTVAFNMANVHYGDTKMYWEKLIVGYNVDELDWLQLMEVERQKYKKNTAMYQVSGAN